MQTICSPVNLALNAVSIQLNSFRLSATEITLWQLQINRLVFFVLRSPYWFNQLKLCGYISENFIIQSTIAKKRGRA